MAKTMTATIALAGKLDPSVKKTISQTQKEVDKLKSGFSAFKGIMGGLGIAALARGAADVAKQVLDIGTSFEDSMAKVKALSGASESEFAALESKAKELGASTRFSASEVADGFGYMSLAGWDTADMLDGITGVLNLAQAAEMDLGEASDIVTDYLTAFGLSAKDSGKFVDQMTFAMANSNTDVTQLGEAYKNCASTAASMGYSVEDTTAVLMTMANAGVKGGEAGTALNSVMTRLATDTKGCATELSKYGVEIYDAEGNMNSLSSILEGMSGIWGNLTDEEQANLSKIVAGTSQYASFQTIMSGLSEKAKEGGQSFTDYAQALENCEGTAANMAGIMNDTVSGDLASMNSAFEGLAISVFQGLEEPFRSAVQTITSGVQFLVANFNTIAPIVMGAVVAVAMFAAIVNFGSIVSVATSALNVLRGAFTALFGAMASNPFGLIVSLIAGLVVALITLWNTNEGFRNAVMGIWENICSIFQGAIDFIGGLFQGFVDFIQPVLDALAPIGDFFGGVFSGVGDFFGGLFGGAGEAAQDVQDVSNALDGLSLDGLEGVDTSNLTTSIQEIPQTATAAVDETNSALASLGTDVNTSLDLSAATASFDQLPAAAASSASGVTSAFDGTGQQISQGFDQAYSTVTATWDQAPGYFSGIWSQITATFQSGAASASAAVGSINSAVSSLIGTLNSVVSAANSASSAISSMNAMKASAGGGLPGLATGGFTNGPTFAGEDPRYPTEAVISFNPAYRQANIGYLMRAANMLGVPLAAGMESINAYGSGYISSVTNTTVEVNFQPNVTIQGNGDKGDIISALRSLMPEFADIVAEALDQRGGGEYAFNI